MNKMWELIKVMIRIGCLGFGGGSALIPMLEKETVEKRNLVTKEEFDKNVVVASMTPGALPVEIASGIGYSVAGQQGMVAGAVGMALPGAILTVLLLMFLANVDVAFFQWIKYLSAGVSVYIIYLLIRFVYKVIVDGKQNGKALPVIAVMAGVSLLNSSKDISSIQILAAAFLVCGGLQWYRIRKEPKALCIDWLRMWKSLRTWLLVGGILVLPACLCGVRMPEYIGRGLLSSYLSFGGGDAYLSVAEGMFVNSGMITEELFYGSLVVIVNILPGSVLCKTLSGVGYLIGHMATGNLWIGAAMAMAGFGISVFSSCSVFMSCLHLYAELDKIKFFQTISMWIRPIIGGLLLNVCLSLFMENVVVLLYSL